MKKKIFAALMASAMVLGMTACGSAPASGDGGSSSGDLIKVGIINNDPNESGYRTANDKDLQATFTKENGYDASFAYSLKNDEQIAAAQKFIQDGVDYLLLSVRNLFLQYRFFKQELHLRDVAPAFQFPNIKFPFRVTV